MELHCNNFNGNFMLFCARQMEFCPIAKSICPGLGKKYAWIVQSRLESSICV